MGTPRDQMGADPSTMDEGEATAHAVDANSPIELSPETRGAEGSTPAPAGEETTTPAPGEEGLTPAGGDGSVTDEATMQTLIEFLRSLFLDAQARQDYLADPGATINQLGLAGVSPSDVHQACGIVADTLPPEPASRLSSYVNQGPSGGGGGGGGVQSAVQEINYVINVTVVDDRDVIISDNDTSVVIGASQAGTATDDNVLGGDEAEPAGEGAAETGDAVNEDPIPAEQFGNTGPPEDQEAQLLIGYREPGEEPLEIADPPPPEQEPTGGSDTPEGP